MDNAVPYIVEKLKGDLVPLAGQPLTAERPIKGVYSDVDVESASKLAANNRPSLIVSYSGSFDQKDMIKEAALDLSIDRASFFVLICVDNRAANIRDVHVQLANIKARVERSMLTINVPKSNAAPDGKRQWVPELPDDLRLTDTDVDGNIYEFGETFAKKPFSKGNVRAKINQGNMTVLPLVYTILTQTRNL